MAVDIEKVMNISTDVWNTNPYVRIFIISMFIYIAGYWQFSFVYVATFAVLWASSHYKLLKSKEKSLENQYAHLYNNPELVKKLFNDQLPSWVIFPDWEKSKFLNSILDVWWPYLKVATEDTIRWSVDPILEYYKPSFLTKLKFGIVNLGDVTPEVLSVKSYNRDEAGNDVILDLELSVKGGEREVTLTAGNMLVSLQAALRDIEISGKFRVVFSRLDNEWPAFKQIRLCFCEKPKLNYNLQAVKIPLSRIPGFVPWLTKLIHTILNDYLVFPNEIVINLDEWWITEEEAERLKQEEAIRQSKRHSIAVRPKGVLQVRVIEATNLNNTEKFGKIDPLCKIWIDKPKSVTKKCPNTMNPVWNESFEFTIIDINTQTLKIEVQNFNFARKNDKLGHIAINLATLSNGSMEQAWYNLKDSKTNARIHLQLEYKKLEYNPLLDQTELNQLMTELSDSSDESESEEHVEENDNKQGGSATGLRLSAPTELNGGSNHFTHSGFSTPTPLSPSTGHDKNTGVISDSLLINEETIKRTRGKTPKHIKNDIESEKNKPALARAQSGMTSDGSNSAVSSLTDTSVSPEKKVSKLSKIPKVFKRQKSQSDSGPSTGFTDCILQVKVIKGIDLVAADSNGLSDPYVTMTFLDDKQKTTIKQETLNPVWNESFTFKINSDQVKDNVEQAVVHIKVKDHDNWGKNDELGFIDISMSDVLMNGGQLLEIFDLKGVSRGKLKMKIQLLVGTGSMLQRSMTDVSDVKTTQALLKKEDVRLSDQ